MPTPKFRRIVALRGTVLIVLLAAGVTARAQEAAKAPANKSHNPRLVPKEARFTTSVTPATARPGDTVEYTVTAAVDPPWHIYAHDPVQPETGPKNTQFDFYDPADLKVGDWRPDRPPVQKKEKAFPELESVKFYEGEVTWTTRLTVPADAPPGPRTLRNQVYFQICNDVGCKPPRYHDLPNVTLTIAAAGAAPAPSAPAAAAAAPTPPPPPPPTEAPAITAAPAVSPPPPVAQGSVEGAIARGILPFLLLCAGGGLFALVMPCVWPMVPITVNFFVKQNQARKGRTFALALTYCVSIIAVFTLVGVLFSAIFGASSLQRLANTAWLNLTVAGLFLLFGLSLLGLFELRLPSFLLNASAQGESRGGLVGVIFMALTLTITSFTCTFPVVGGLLVVASRGGYFYPVIGLATFAAVLALPFFLLALSPSLLQRMPRSGDWMNTVKVVGGLMEIGAAFKFLNTAEIALGATSETAWFDAEFVLTIWVVLAAVAGIYLLGLFRTDHDHEAIQVGPIRLLLGAVGLAFALYMAPALFGMPPQSKVYNLFLGLLPPDAHKLNWRTEVAGLLANSGTLVAADGEGGAVKATSPIPELAEREEKRFHGVQWGMSLDQAKETASAENRLILIDFTGVNCANCRQMEQEVLPLPEIRDRLKRFVTVSLYTDFVDIESLSPNDRRERADQNAIFQQDLVNDTTTPLYVAMTPEGRVIGSTGYSRPDAFRRFLESALAKAPGATDKVAQAR